jgi:NAD(P)-dependent dehydrogenase (short-subunit alcohol dehydrogenase family)
MTTDRTVLVTGAASGIGKATAEAFKADGWSVIGVDREEGAAGDRSVVVDLADAGAIESMVESLADVGSLRALVNNAGMSLDTSVLETTVSDWDRLMATNIRAAHLLTSLLVPRMRDGGAIVNVASVHAVATTPGASAYAASKAALVGYTRAAAIELGERGIRVNAVLPGAVDTPMLVFGVQGDERRRKLQEMETRTPLGRIGRPEEIAQAILFLADDERSSFITGQTLVVDGGALARLSIE